MLEMEAKSDSTKYMLKGTKQLAKRLKQEGNFLWFKGKNHSEVNFKSLIMQDVTSPSIVENLHVDIY